MTVITGIYDKSDIRSERLVTQCEIDGIDVRVVRFTLSNYQSFPRRIISFLGYALMSIWTGLKVRADVLYVSSGPLTVGIPGIVLSILKQIPMVFEVRDLWPGGAISLGIIKNRLMQKALWWLEARCYRHARLVVPASVGMEADIKNRFPEVPTLVIPNASDIEFFNNRIRKDALGQKCYFLYFGTIGFANGCTQIVKAAKVLHDRNRKIEVVFLGDGKELPLLKQMAQHWNLSNVTFLPEVSKVELVPWVKGAVATILTFRKNPVLDTSSPNKMFDSFAAGTPVIQTTQGWIKEMFEKERCGITVPPDDPEAMADAIELLADNPELREDMGRNAFRLAKTKFERRQLALRLLDQLEEITGKKKEAVYG